LPKRLEYEFLGPDKTYPVIVSDKLSFEENEKLLNLLKKHRKVIGYSITDLKGLSPAAKNEKNELILQRTVTGWRMCIDYRKLSKATKKRSLPLTFQGRDAR
jgi:hypothetical protein